MADEKEVTIKVTTETDTAELEELDSLIEEIQDKAEIEGTVEVDDTSVTDALDTTEQLNDDLTEIDGMTVSPDVDTSGLEALSSEAEDTVSSLDSLGTAMVGIGASAGVDEMISTADRINTSWNQLELTFGSVTGAMKQDISDAAAATGRSGGEIRGYFNQMGIAGVTNTQLLEDSFEALSGKAYQTGNSIESMESKMQTMVLTGNASNRMLKTLGLSAEDLAAAMGVSADQVQEAFKNMTAEERLQAITKAMGDGAAANEMYKNSYAGLKAQADVAMAGLMGAIGQAILPVVVPALQAATTAIQALTAGFQALPGPVQAIIGGIGGFAAIALAVVGILGTLGQVISIVSGGLQALNILTNLSTIATEAAAAAQWLLNIAMSANPIGIVIIAIAALIVILGYLYLNNEKVRNAVNNLGAKLQWLAGIIVSSISSAVNQFSQIVQGIPRALQACLDWAYNIVMSHPLVQALVWLGNQAVRAFSVIGLGQSSPGKIVKAMKQELDWTSEAIYNSNLASDTARLGAGMANSFNPNLNTGGSSGAGIGGTVINIYGDVDSDKRVQQIIDVIRNELNWNNTTAGRVV